MNRQSAVILFKILCGIAIPGTPIDALAQNVDDKSDAVIGLHDTRIILDLVRQNLKNAADAKVTSLRRSKGSIVCGSVNVKNHDGLYLGERGFIADLSDLSFGRLPEGPELMNPKEKDFVAKEKVRAAYFDLCLD